MNECLHFYLNVLINNGKHSVNMFDRKLKIHHRFWRNSRHRHSFADVA